MRTSHAQGILKTGRKELKETKKKSYSRELLTGHFIVNKDRIVSESTSSIINILFHTLHIELKRIDECAYAS